MVLLTLGAQAVETVVVRGVVYTVELGARLIYWVGSTAIGYLWPAEPKKTEVELLGESIRELQSQVAVLEEREGMGGRTEAEDRSSSPSVHKHAD
jgi:hypothetical protein